MIDNKMMIAKAYKEVLEILKYIPKEDYDKLPKYIIENMEKEQDKEHIFCITKFDDFEHQEMMKETEVILSVLYRDYWATEEQRKAIHAMEHFEKRKIEEEKSKKYKSSNNIFQKEEIIKNKKEQSSQNQLVQVKQEGFLRRAIMKIKSFFRHRDIQ